MALSDSDVLVNGGVPPAAGGLPPFNAAPEYRINSTAMRDLHRALVGTSLDVFGLVFGSHTARGPLIERFELLPPPAGDDDDWLGKALASFFDGAMPMPPPLGFFHVRSWTNGPDHLGPSGRGGFQAPGPTLLRQPAAGAPFGALHAVNAAEQGFGLHEMTSTDCDLVRRYLPRLPLHRGVFLVIQRFVDHPWSAALFALDADWVPGRPPALVFPFDEYIQSELQTRPIDDPAPTSGELPQIADAAGRKRHWPSRNAPWIIAAVLTAALTVGGGIAVYKRLRPADANGSAQTDGSKSGSLALNVNRSGQYFEISWNRSADVLRQATGGTLTIHDGGTTRTVQLDGSQLREVKILYSPVSSELSFKLEVTMAAESVQVLGWDAAPPLSQPNSAPDRLAQGVPSFAGGSAALSQISPQASEPQRATPAATNLTTNSPGTIARSSARGVPETPGASRAPGPADITGSPQVRRPAASPPNSSEPEPRPTAQAPAQAAIQRSSQGMEPTRIVGSNPESRVASTPTVARNQAPQAPEGHGAKAIQPPQPVPAPSPQAAQAQPSRAPVPDPKVGGGLQSAKLLRMVQPVYPPEALSAHVQGVVRFKATIGKNGSVRDLQLMSGNALLVQAAIDAAKRWSYRPALLDGEPTETTLQVDVVFKLD